MRSYVLVLVAVAVFFVSVVSADALCVNSGTANLRRGPGVKYEKTWQVFKYMPLKKIKRKGQWYKVKDVDGDIHWIFRKLVTGKYKCAVVKKNKANIRKGPGKKYPRTDISPAIKYDSFRVLKFKGKWVQVIDEFGEKGWVFKKLLWIQ